MPAFGTTLVAPRCTTGAMDAVDDARGVVVLAAELRLALRADAEARRRPAAGPGVVEGSPFGLE